MLRIAAYFLFFIGCAFALDFLIDSGFRKMTTGNFGVSNRIYRGEVNAEVIVSGSSRAVTHFDSRLIESGSGLTCFNIGSNGVQIDMQVAYLDFYLQRNKAPRYILHGLDAFSFEVTSGEVYDPAQYYPYLDEDALYEPLAGIDSDAWKARWVPLYGYAVDDLRMNWVRGLLAHAGRQPREFRFQGYEPRDELWSTEFDGFKAANPDGVEFEVQPAGVKVVERLVAICREHGSELILVYSPEFAEVQDLTRNRAEIFAEFNRICRENEVALWDYSDWEHADDTDYFRNSQHLNAEGARLFSLDVGDRLSEMLKKEGRGFNPGGRHQSTGSDE